jgi:hypothetical protein
MQLILGIYFKAIFNLFKAVVLKTLVEALLIIVKIGRNLNAL